jgi:antimicrobial peptide system SdpA family protein
MRTLTRLGLALVLVATVWLAIIVVVAHRSLPHNPVRLPVGTVVLQFIGATAPQGWAFFTRNPREPTTLMYRRAPDGQWKKASIGPTSRPAYLFGLDRSARAQALEMGWIFQNMTFEEWVPCDEIPEQCLQRFQIQHSITNEIPSPTLCGAIGFARVPPVPWAWRRSLETITMPSKVVAVQMSCPSFSGV